MCNKICFIFLISSLCILTVSSAQDIDSLIYQLRNEYERMDNIKPESRALLKVSYSNLFQIKQNIFNIKQELQSVNIDLNNPIYFRNDIIYDNNLDIVDFYLYEYSDDYYRAFVRIKNKQRKYLEWVKLNVNFYKNESFAGTDFAYIDFESYGYSGISPYKYSFINIIIDKVEFDSIAFQFDYDTADGNGDILWDQMLEVKSSIIRPSGSLMRWQGEVQNKYNYSMTFPKIYGSIIEQGRMVALDFTFLDVQDNTMQPNSSSTFSSYIDLPDYYDEIQCFLTYSLYSLEGIDNLPPNIPIFTNKNFTGYSRANTDMEVFVIDPDGDRVDLSIDFGDGYTSPWDGDFISGYNAIMQHPYSQSGVFSVQAKASDGVSETQWSESASILISLSSLPVISTVQIKNASYKKPYNFQLQSSGGITPIEWQLYNSSLPPGLSLNSVEGSISGQPLNSGLFDFTVYCLDAGTPSASDTMTFQLNVNNHKPSIISQDSINTYVNTPVNYELNAVDPDSNQIDFEFINLPNWLMLSNSTLNGIAPNQILETSFSIIASDGELTDSLVVHLTFKTSSSVNSEIIPNHFQIYNNYPNPFNPITHIIIDIPYNIKAELHVYDINGKLVEELYNGQFNAGVHSVVWDAYDRPSGVYFIRFNSKEYNDIIKCTLLR